MVSMSRRERPARAVALLNKQRYTYQESSSDPNDDEELERKIFGRSLRSSTKRHRTPSVEDSSADADRRQRGHENDSVVVVGSSGPLYAQPLPKSSRASRKTKARPAVASRGRAGAPGAKRARTTSNGDGIKADKKVEEFDIFKLGGRVPPWQTLPYEILLQIFQYAWNPLVNQDFYPSPIVTSGSLLQTALLCKGFAEPALAALYNAPPMSPPSRAFKLLALLQSQSEQSYLNYRGLIKHLNVDSLELLCRKYHGQEPIELGELLSFAPTIRTIGLHLLYDQPSRHKAHYFMMHKVQGKRRAYQSGLFHALGDTDLRLLDWTWNGILAQQSHRRDMPFVEYHQQKAFKTLKTLTLVNANHLGHIESFARSTGLLPHLTAVVMKNVDVPDVENLQLLSKKLTGLHLINCPFLDAKILAEFLRSHGSSLRELVLDHNDYLGLSFLEELSTSCPKLEKIKMDLRFFNNFPTYRSSEPKVKVLLEADCRLGWPKTLHHIEFLQLRKWDMAAAENFFSSLVDSSSELPDLRYIDIKASLTESNWRDRISFRNRWVSRMENVFKRVSAPPDPRFRTLATFEAHKKEFRDAKGSAKAIAMPMQVMAEDVPQSFHSDAGNSPGSSDALAASQRRSSRRTARSLRPADQPVQRRKARKRRKRKNTNDNSSSSEEDSAFEDSGITEDGPPSVEDDVGDLHVQGMCDVVRVAIDNLRPTEEHLDESCFLDDELSGDEDWNGDGGGD
ncbi:MAG: hypothetical protein LQ345_002868 [Seirophora villosa]|nr:MAG: hypothetical protein LQ345_002868 [Seirophora villosa]